MINPTEKSSSEPCLCLSCGQFWGSPVNKGLCSGCFKKQSNDSVSKPKTPQEAQPSVTVSAETIVPPQPQPDKSRCNTCRKKVGLLGIECKCGLVHCGLHRLPEDHSCSFNHQEAALAQLKKQVVKVSNTRIVQL